MHERQVRLLEDLLERSLRSELPMTRVNRRDTPFGKGAEDEVITTCRFILVLKGSLRYTIEGNEYAFGAGMHFLIPSWRRRWWSAADTGCEIIWCEFYDDPKEIQPGGCFYRQLSMTERNQVKRRYLEMLRLWQKLEAVQSDEGKLIRLELEGLLKGMLATFIPKVEVDTTMVMDDVRSLHRDIKQTLEWLDIHYAKPDVLEGLHEHSSLTPNYFRLRFKEALRCTPGEYVKQLRMRQARYLLKSTDWQLKRISIEVGYADPLYFSRVYRSFWGINPSHERLS